MNHDKFVHYIFSLLLNLKKTIFIGFVTFVYHEVTRGDKLMGLTTYYINNLLQFMLILIIHGHENPKKDYSVIMYLSVT